MSDLDVAAIRPLLLEWFDAHQRALPWRARQGEEPDPYRVWLSEVMLQQTRVETVRPYFERWLHRFPDLQAFAAADLDEVLKMWEGLGYYARARNFHRAAREVAAEYGGRVPSAPERFRALPGVGPYTAGAVMSIAFGREEPIVDGNVRRVLARLIDDPAPADALLWALAGRLVLGARPGDLNQALMELGALVCTPRTPECARCPLADQCRARAAGTVDERPLPRSRGALPVEHHGVAVIDGPAGILVRRRPERGRLGGMWEFPGIERHGDETSAAAARRALREIVDLPSPELTAGGLVSHTFTHVKVVYQVFHGTVENSCHLPPNAAWATPDGLTRLALPRAQQRIMALRSPGDPAMSPPAW